MLRYLIGSWLLLATSVQAETNLSQLEKAWSLSPLREKIRHPLEGLKLQETAPKELQVSTWYEDISVTKAAPPSQNLLCRFMHSFLYGRSRPRSDIKQITLLPEHAFQKISGLERIKFTFFAVIYENEPRSPFWDRNTNPTQSEEARQKRLRVIWDREERIVPYLSLEVNKAEWLSASRILKSHPNPTFSDFRNSLCGQAYKLLPNVRSNFAQLDKEVTE